MRTTFRIAACVCLLAAAVTMAALTLADLTKPKKAPDEMLYLGAWQGTVAVFDRGDPATPRSVTDIDLSTLRDGLAAGRSEEAVAAHTSRYGTEYYPLTAGDHLDLLRQTGFSAAELFWRSYLQCGFYAIR